MKLLKALYIIMLYCTWSISAMQPDTIESLQTLCFNKFLSSFKSTNNNEFIEIIQKNTPKECNKKLSLL